MSLPFKLKVKLRRGEKLYLGLVVVIIATFLLNAFHPYTLFPFTDRENIKVVFIGYDPDHVDTHKLQGYLIPDRTVTAFGHNGLSKGGVVDPSTTYKFNYSFSFMDESQVVPSLQTIHLSPSQHTREFDYQNQSWVYYSGNFFTVSSGQKFIVQHQQNGSYMIYLAYFRTVGDHRWFANYTDGDTGSTIRKGGIFAFDAQRSFFLDLSTSPTVHLDQVLGDKVAWYAPQSQISPKSSTT